MKEQTEEEDKELQHLLSSVLPPAAPYGLADRVMRQIVQDSTRLRVRRYTLRALAGVVASVSLLLGGIFGTFDRWGDFGADSALATDSVTPLLWGFPLLALLVLLVQAETVLKYWWGGRTFVRRD